MINHSRAIRARGAAFGGLALAAILAGACSEAMPTALDPSRLPAEPVTLEIEVPWSSFGANLEVFGGYGGPSQLEEAIVARSFEGVLDAHALVRFGTYPISASVVDSTGTTRTDTNLTFTGGNVVVYFDTEASTATGPVTLTLSRTQEEWHEPSASWAFALDTVGTQRAWTTPGGGAVLPLASREWDPATGDSVMFVVDSSTVAAWRDQDDPTRGARIELGTDGERLHLVQIGLRLATRSSINPDTILNLSAATREVTFLYTPAANAPLDGIRVGGAPAWRTVLDLNVPTQLDGPPELCSAVGCPFALGPEHVSRAGLVLTTRAAEPAFRPTDSLALDVRAVLSREALPKSPLGSSLIGDDDDARVVAEAFGAQAGMRFEIPVTAFVKAALSGPDDAGRPPPNTVAILPSAEAGSFAFGSFHGADVPEAPVLRLIITASRPMEMR